MRDCVQALWLQARRSAIGEKTELVAESGGEEDADWIGRVSRMWRGRHIHILSFSTSAMDRAEW